MPDFTVTIAGPERHEGHKPYDYAVTAPDKTAATTKAVRIFKDEQEVEDTVVLKVVEGVPVANCGYAWNDRRDPYKPIRLRLLKVSRDGYTVGTGEQRKVNQVTITHEQIVAVLVGLADIGFVNQSAIAGDTINAIALADAANFAKRQLAGVAWALDVCSWDSEFRAIPRDGNPFHQSD